MTCQEELAAYIAALQRIANPFTGHAPGSLLPGERGPRDIAKNVLRQFGRSYDDPFEKRESR